MQQVMQIVNANTTQAAGLVTCVAKVELVYHNMQGLQVHVEEVV